MYGWVTLKNRRIHTVANPLYLLEPSVCRALAHAAMPPPWVDLLPACNPWVNSPLSCDKGPRGKTITVNVGNKESGLAGGRSRLRGEQILAVLLGPTPLFDSCCILLGVGRASFSMSRRQVVVVHQVCGVCIPVMLRD